MAKECILAIDQGTTNTKALLYDRCFQPLFRCSEEVRLLQPHAGWVEQDPIELWASVVAVAAKCSAYAREHDARMTGVALTNQRETALAWRPIRHSSGSAGTPVGNAMTWQCRRSTQLCQRMQSDAGAVQAVAGLPFDPLLSATKWAWLLEAEPALHAAAASGEVLFGTVDSWILFNLTGGAVHATDHTNASRTGLMSLQTLDWDEGLLSTFHLPRRALAEIRSSSGDFGFCTGIPALAAVPIVAAIGDSHGAFVGHGCFTPGAVKATYGTGSSLVMLTEKLVERNEGLARTVAWSIGGDVRFALEGNIAMSGAALQWVGEFLGLARPAEDAAKLAETVPDSAGLVLVPAMVGLGAPYWDAVARGIACNLQRSHTAAHLARAAIDSIAHQVADVLQCMEQAGDANLPALMADGGATRNDALMQTQADLIGRPVLRSSHEELSALGAAMLGALALGWCNSLAELAPSTDQDRFEPSMSQADRHTQRRQWSTAVRRARLQDVSA